MYTAEIVFTKTGARGILVYPDFYDLFTQVGDLPDQDTLAVIQMLRGEGGLPKQDYLQKIIGDVHHYTRLYRLAALCFYEPRLILMRRKCQDCGRTWDGEIKTCEQCASGNSRAISDRNAGEIGPRDLTIHDLIAIQDYFFHTAATEISPADAHDIGGPTESLLSSGGVPHDASSINASVRAGTGDLVEPLLPVGA